MTSAAGDGPHKLAGWTRLCYSDISVGGSSLIWDWDQERVRLLASRAERVRIQSKGCPEEAVVSRPGAYPITDLRRGRPIGFERALDEADTELYWASDNLLLLSRLSHVCECWEDHHDKDEVCQLATNVYWAACNGHGLHWHGFVQGGHLPPASTWDNQEDVDLELYVDAEDRVEAEWPDRRINVVVRDLSGSVVASLPVPFHETVAHLKRRLREICGHSVYTQRLVHPNHTEPLGDDLHLRTLPAPVELQLVCLPLDTDMGKSLLEPAIRGDVRTVVKLLGSCACPSASDLEGTTPLMLASQMNQMQVVRILCDAGAEVNHATLEVASALFLAATFGHAQVVHFLLQRGARQDGLARPMHAAARNGHVSVAEVLCATGEDPNCATANGGTPLQKASQGGHASLIGLLIDAGADKDLADQDGWTPLLLAAHGGQCAAVAALCASRADIDKAFPDGSTPLLVATAAQQTEVVGLLCAARADAEKRRRVDGAGPLHMAAKSNLYSVVGFLCGAGAAVDGRLPNGMSPLAVAATNGRLEVAKELCQRGAVLNVRTESGVTPLLLAAVAGHADFVSWLGSVGAAVNERHVDGRTALSLAAGSGYLEVVERLHEAKADLNLADLNGWTPLLEAERLQLTAIADWLRSAGAVEVRGVSTYLVDKTSPCGESPGLGYRQSKELTDVVADGAFAVWGATVVGVDEGDGWVKVGERYLPVELEGVRVVTPTSLTAASGHGDEDACAR